MQSQDDCKDVLSHGNVIVWTADPRTLKLQTISENAGELLGCPTDGVLQEPGFWSAQIHREDRERVLSTVHSAIASGSGYRVMYRFIPRPEKVIWLMDVVRLVKGPSGECTQLRGFTLDLTDCGDPEGEQRQQAILQQMSDNIQEIFWMLDTATSHAIFVNPAFEKITGYSRESLLASPLSYRTIIHPEDRERVLQRLEEAGVSGKFDEQFRIIRKDGTPRWVAVQGFPIRDSSGAIYRLGGVVQDVTRQQSVEAALHESEDRYRDLVEHSEDLLCTHDLNGRLLSCNAAPARILGYSLDEILNLPMRELLAPEFRHEFDDYLKRVQQDGVAHGLMVLLSRNGERRIWEYRNTLRTGGRGGPVVRGMAHDVTERRRAEAELRKSEQRFRVALKSAPIMVSTQDRSLRYTWIYNPLLAWAKTDCIGKTDQEILQPEEAVAQLTELKRKVLASGMASRTRIEFAHESRVYCFDITIEPVVDSAGKVNGVTCASLDVTDLRDRATRLHLLLETTASLASALKLEELLGAISSNIQGVIHHDFASVSVYDMGHGTTCTYPLDLATARALNGAEKETAIDPSLVRQFTEHPDLPVSWHVSDNDGQFAFAQPVLGSQIRTVCCIPLQLENGIASLNLGSTKEEYFDAADLYILKQLATQVSIAFRNAFRYRTLQSLKDRLQAQTRYLERAIEMEAHSVEVLGSSNGIREAINRAQLMSQQRTTVMIVGEPGTGRESLARRIHSTGPRSQNAFIKFDCRGNSRMRLERDLLGYNAEGPNHTLLEFASHGTLYIHEITDLSLESQRRLIPLFDPPPSPPDQSTNAPFDVRWIVSASPDILKASMVGKFLRELYDRIAVFQIDLPALRDRPEDIPELVNHFVDKYALRYDKRFKPVSNRAMKILAKQEWTGNVRQLESAVEWAVVSARGPSLKDLAMKGKKAL